MDAKKKHFPLLIVASALFALPLFTNNHRADIAMLEPAQAAMPPMAVPIATPAVMPIAAQKAALTASAAATKANEERMPTQPLDNMRITSPFGSRMHPILHRVENHPGVDVGAKLNDPIHAVYDGVVSRAGWRGGYGNAVEIYHPKLHKSTLYGHMSAIEVRAGQRVAEGQTIGLAGTTGLSTGVHLHFGVMNARGWTDPIAFLDGLTDAPASTMIATAPAAPRSYKPVVVRRSVKQRERLERAEVVIASAPATSKKRTATKAKPTVATETAVEVAVAPKVQKPKVDMGALQDRYSAAAKAAEMYAQLYETGAVSRNDRDAKVAAAQSLQAQLKAAKS